MSYGQAYGPQGLGILTVAGIPGLPQMRQRLLPLTTQFVVRLLGQRLLPRAALPSCGRLEQGWTPLR